MYLVQKLHVPFLSSSECTFVGTLLAIITIIVLFTNRRDFANTKTAKTTTTYALRFLPQLSTLDCSCLGVEHLATRPVAEGFRDHDFVLKIYLK